MADVLGMRAGYILPVMVHNAMYHTRKHGVSQYKGLTMDKSQLMFIDKNKQFQMVDNTFNALVQFLAVNRVMKLGEETENTELGIGL